MSKVCPKCVFAVVAGLLAAVILVMCAKECHLWSVLGIGLAVGICMVVGERLPKDGTDNDNNTASP